MLNYLVVYFVLGIVMMLCMWLVQGTVSAKVYYKYGDEIHSEVLDSIDSITEKALEKNLAQIIWCNGFYHLGIFGLITLIVVLWPTIFVSMWYATDGYVCKARELYNQKLEEI